MRVRKELRERCLPSPITERWWGIFYIKRTYSFGAFLPTAEMSFWKPAKKRERRGILLSGVFCYL